MGRVAGAPNKNKSLLIRTIKKQFPDYDAIIELVRIAVDTDNDVSVRLQANKEVAQYVYPKLKAIEVAVDVESEIKVKWAKQ